MATKSFLNNIVIKDEKLADKFISALENAENKNSKKVTYAVEDVSDTEKIRKIFNK